MTPYAQIIPSYSLLSNFSSSGFKLLMWLCLLEHLALRRKVRLLGIKRAKYFVVFGYCTSSPSNSATLWPCEYSSSS